MYLLRKIAIPLTKQCSQTFKNYSNNSINRVLSVVSEQINATSSINIKDCAYNIFIKPNDILNPADVNTLRATLISNDASDQPSASLNISIQDNSVNIISADAEGGRADRITCVLEVPVRSDLNISSASGNIHIEKLYSDDIKIRTTKNIFTKNLQGFKFDLESTDGGDIHCAGSTLANQIHIRTRNNGVCNEILSFY